jgi:hypothetical protein
MSCSRYYYPSVSVPCKTYARAYQRNDNLAIRVCLEVVRGLERLAEDSVVVDLTVDSQGDGSLIVDEGLSAGL